MRRRTAVAPEICKVKVMRIFRIFRLAALLAAVSSFVPLVIRMDMALAADNTVRAEVGKPLQAAQELIKQQKYREALAKLREAEAVGDLTEFENGVIEQLRGAAAAGSGDYRTAAKSYEAVLAAGRPPAEPLKLIQAIAGFYYQAKDYPKAASWVNRYVSEGGSDPQTRALLAQSYYLAGDYTAAGKTLREQIKEEEGAHRPVTEAQLQLLLSTGVKGNDEATTVAALEKLVIHHPTPEYWTELLRRAGAGGKLGGHFALDRGRLALAVGALSGADAYVDFIELALQAGYPGEAKAVIDKGFGAGILGTGADADRHKRLRDLATRNASEDLRGLAGAEKEAAARPDGGALVSAGVTYLGYGQPDKAISLIEQGLARGGVKSPEEARLHLGRAYLAAGRKDKAAQAFRSVQGTDGAASLAHLWGLLASAG
ncbi:tetratricopeptide repeat protein [Telmatospirillum siberiense]|uniref:Tetratricopeptide repeat-like domain-containing protein n=1 Tax=Telmatospirillum siberiense TaxID=382514 RepID=A0A2N3PQ45_9PROT|nr:tetratricopeptide repeat protein [Telmatospirillum siberiense]PKU22514.1 hypothetical protein CWS72_21560 [Telmatospirillum siberiense]